MSRNCSYLASVFDPINFNSMEIEDRHSVVSGRASQDLEAQGRHLGRFQMYLLQEIERMERLEKKKNNKEIILEKKKTQVTNFSAKFKKYTKALDDDKYTELEQKMADKYYEQMKNEKPEHVGRFVILKIEKEGNDLPKEKPLDPFEIDYDFGDCNLLVEEIRKFYKY